MLIFDFDGVLMDSVDEMAVTAYNGMTGELITSLEELPGHALGLFRTNRFHVQKAGEAVPLMTWCLDHAGEAPDTRLASEEYQALQREAPGTVDERTAHFFATRKRFLERDAARWRALNRPYRPLWEALRSRGGERVVILTNKNREAALNLCRHFDLMVRPEHIYSGDHGVTKIENLLRIQHRFRTTAHTFVDDVIDNLRELDVYFNRGRKVLKLLLASWGYAGPDDAAAARRSGYARIGQEELIAMLDEELPAMM